MFLVYLFMGLFNDAVINSEYAASNDYMVSEQWNDVGGRGRHLTLSLNC